MMARAQVSLVMASEAEEAMRERKERAQDEIRFLDR